MKKKFLALLLALVMVVGMLPMAALAAEGEEPTTTGVITIKNTKAEDDGENVIAPTDSMLWLNGGSYQLAEDIEVACFGGASKNTEKVTIDLNGHKITQSSSSEYATCYVDNDLPEFEIKNTDTQTVGSIVANNQYATIQVGGEGAKVTIGENVTLTKIQSREDDSAFAIAVTADATGTPTIDLNGCTIDDVNGITVNGLCAGNPKITLTGVTIKATGTGIYQAGPSDISDVSVKDSSITGGDLGIEVRAGKLTLENSTIKGGNGDYAVNANGGGTTTSNAAVAVSQHTTAKDIVVTLDKNVKCEATAALSLANPQNNTTGKVEFNVSGGEYKGEIKVAENLTNAELVITGGTFSVDPSAYVPTTHKATKDSTANTWTVAEKETVTAPAVTFSISQTVDLGNKANLVDKEIATLTIGADNVIKVPTLTAEYIQNWTEFNGTDVSEQNGNYLPLKITLAGEATKDSIAKVEVIGSKTKTWTNDGTNFNFFTEDEGKSETLIMQLNKLVGNAGEDKTGPADGHFKIVITPKVDEGETAQATTYDIDCTGVTLKLPASPEKTENQDGSAEIKFEDEAAKKQEAANVTNIINAVKAPNKTDDSAEGVETTQNTATIAYDVTTTGGEAATGTVTLPTIVSKALQQDGSEDANKIDVKVNIVTDAATVTLSSEAIDKLSGDHDTEIKAEPKTKSDVTTVTDDPSKALVDHIDNGVDVTVKANSADLITSSSPLPDEGALEITMKVKATSGSVHILYLNATANKFELIGTYPVDENGCVTFKVKHLCEFYEVASNSTTDPLVANLTKSDNTPKSLELTIGTTGAFRTATVTNLAANGQCTVQVCREANAAPAVILVLDANSSGTATFQVNAGSVVTVWKDQVTFDASGAPSDSTLEHVTKTA